MTWRDAWERLSASQTRMTLRNRGQPTGFSALLAPFLALLMRRENRKDLRLLKKILEEQAPGQSLSAKIT